MPSSNCCFLTCKQVSQEVGRVGSCFWYTVQFLMLRNVFLLLWTIFKVFIEFVTVLFLFSVFLFPFPYGTLAHWPGMEATPPTVEGKGLTTGSPGKSLPATSSWWVSYWLTISTSSLPSSPTTSLSLRSQDHQIPRVTLLLLSEFLEQRIQAISKRVPFCAHWTKESR